MSARLATVDDYRWLFHHTDYMLPAPSKRWRYWERQIAERCRDRLVWELGCGRAAFGDWVVRHALASGYIGTDPATRPQVPWPDAADVCVSFDVLEHVPTGELDDMLVALSARAPLQIHAVANMSDLAEVGGEVVQLHHTQEPPDWWLHRVHDLTGAAVQVLPWRSPCRFLLIWGMEV